MTRLLVGRVSSKKSRNMRAIKSKNTSPEKQLFSLLKSMNLHFKRHCKKIIGRPDAALLNHNVVIFCDGDFWHGRNWASTKECFRVRKDFWINKIESTIRRDRRNNKMLKAMGFKVVRIWSSDLRKDPKRAKRKIKKAIG